MHALQNTIQEFMSRVKAGSSQPASGAATPVGPGPTGPAEEQRVAQQAFTALARLIKAGPASSPLLHFSRLHASSLRHDLIG